MFITIKITKQIFLVTMEKPFTILLKNMNNEFIVL